MEVELNRCSLTNQSMTVLTDKSEVNQTDAALLVEELAEIYTTPTPKGWHGAKKK